MFRRGKRAAGIWPLTHVPGPGILLLVPFSFIFLHETSLHVFALLATKGFGLASPRPNQSTTAWRVFKNIVKHLTRLLLKGAGSASLHRKLGTKSLASEYL